MSFSKVNISKSRRYNADFLSNVRSARQYAHGVATSRSMSNKRLVFSILSLLLGLFSAYSSFFYFPAYSSSKNYIKVSTQNGPIPVNGKSADANNPYLNYLLMNQGYLKAGQSVVVSYETSPGTQLELTVSKCAGPMVFEIYSCRGTIIETIETESSSSRFDLTVTEAGFYQFSEKLTDTSMMNGEYKIIWKRK